MAKETGTMGKRVVKRNVAAKRRLVVRPKSNKLWLMAGSALITTAVLFPTHPAMATCGTVNNDFICIDNPGPNPETTPQTFYPGVDGYEVRIGIEGDPGNPGTIDVSSTSHALSISGSGYDGNIYITAPSSIDNNGSGDALHITGVGDLGIFNDGELTSQNGGDALYIQGFEDLTIVNNGTIHATGGGDGIYGQNGEDVSITNTSPNSMIGINGVNMSFVDNFELINSGGVTAGTSEDGVDLYEISGDDPIASDFGDLAVSIVNSARDDEDLGYLDGGLIAGYWNGIEISNVMSNNIQIDNGGYFVGEDSSYSLYDGGLIVGKWDNGVDIESFYGNVLINNSNTNDSAAVEPSDDYTNVSSLLDNLPSGFTAGIWGEDNGIQIDGYDYDNSSNESGFVGVLNFDGRIGGMEDNGISIQNLMGDVDALGDGRLAAFALINGNNGIVWGGWDDGVYVDNVYGDVHIDNAGSAQTEFSGLTMELLGPDAFEDSVPSFAGGNIFGEDSGVAIYNVYGGDVTVLNSEGFIYGDDYDGVQVEGVTYQDGQGGHVGILNGGIDMYDAPIPGGWIIGDDSAVDISGADTAFVWNGEGGLLIGDGYFTNYSDGQYAVIRLNNSSSADLGFEDADVAANLIVNWGVMAGDELPNYYDNGSSGTLDMPDIDFYEDDLRADLDLFASYVMSGGSKDQLDGSEFGEDLSGYNRVGEDSLVWAPGGALDLENYDLMFGRVFAPGFNDATIGEDIGSEIVNYGTWFVADNFGDWYNNPTEGFAAFLYDGNDNNNAIHNLGWVQTAFGFGEDTGTFATEDFYNGSGEYAGVLEWSGAPSIGIISMVDDFGEDAVYIEGNFHGVSDEEYDEYGYRSYVAMDVFLQDSADFYFANGYEGSDGFYVGEDLTGTTGFIFRQINDGPVGEGVLDARIYVAEVDGYVDSPTCYDTLCRQGDAFYIAPQTDGYFEAGGVGLIEDGLFAWGLTQEYYSGEDYFFLVGLPGPGALNAPRVITGAQEIFYDTLNVVEDNNYANQFAGSGGGGADLSTDYSAPYAAPAGSSGGTRTGLWAKATGSWAERDSTVDFGGGSVDTGSNQDTYSILGGADMKPGGADSPIRLGLFGGYVTSTLDFDLGGASGSHVDYEGGVVGGYAAYNNGAFYVDGTVKGDILSATYTFSGTDVDADVNSVGVALNTGYRMTMGSAFFEPIASFTYVHTTVDDVTTPGGSVDFSNGTSLRAGAGARLGTVMPMGGGTAEVSVLGKVWNEFEGDNTVTVSDGVTTDTYTDDTSGVFGEASARVTVTSADGTLSGFLSGGGKFSSDYTSWNAQVGVRKGF